LCMPLSATSFFSASRTRSLPEERHPAAMQTWTRCEYFFCATRSVSAICRSSSMVMGNPFSDAVQHALRTYLAHYRAVEHHRGCQPARSETACGKQRKLAVGRGFTRLDAVLRFNSVEQRRRSLYVARSPGAHDARMPAFWLEREEVIKRSSAEDAAEWHAQQSGNE